MTVTGNPFYLTEAPEDLIVDIDHLRNGYIHSLAHDFAFFVSEFWECVPGAGNLIWNWHMGVLCDELQEAAERVFYNEPRKYDLVINVPFGTSKSTIGSILFHPWTWIRFPEGRHLTATHTETLALDLANKSREVIRSEKYRELFPHVRLRDNQDAKGYYANDLGGVRQSFTVGGKNPMGFHFHFLGVDDPLDPQKAVSEAELLKAKEFMNQTLPSRKVNKMVSFTYLIMQRLHRRDPTQVMMDRAKLEDAADVRKLCLPGEITDDVEPASLRDHYIDGLLDPVRLPRKILKEYRATLGPYGYSGQVLQKPSPPGGGMFKEQSFAKRVRSAPYDSRRVRYWDRAACLIANTMIETVNGPLPIETIVPGDLVLTRRGYRRVKWAGVSGLVDRLVSVLFSNGSVLTGTPDHPVWDDAERNWVDLASLDGGCYNLALPVHQGEQVCLDEETQVWNRSYSMGFTTAGRRGGGILGLCAGIRSERSIGRTPCTGQSGVSTTVISPLVIRSITRTRIGITTTLRILNASLLKSITRLMGFSGNGTILRRLLRTGNESPNWGGRLPARLSKSSVCSVVRCERHEGLEHPQSIAPPFVGSTIGIERSAKYVPFVESHFWEGQKRIGVCGAVQRQALELNKVPVYDLQVEGEHEFFANGILVHNTEDGGCYTAGVLLTWGKDGNWYVEHCVHGQWEPDERNDVIIATAHRDRSRYGPKHDPTIVIEAERGSTGLESYRNIARRLAGFKVKEDQPTGRKDVRAEPWADAVAAGIVRIVDNGESEGTGKGDWDIANYVEEHCLFKPEPEVKRLGKYKDQVDASSGGFNYLTQGQRQGGMRILNPRVLGKSVNRRIIACSFSELEAIIIEQKCLLVTLCDPEDVMCNAGQLSSLDVDAGEGGRSRGTDLENRQTRSAPTLPPHSLQCLMDSLELTFADIDPAEVQDTWGQSLPPWNKPAADLIMTREDGKKLWAFVTKKRDHNWEVLVICDDGDRRASSMAISLTDTLRLPREKTIWLSGDDDRKMTEEDEPDNRFIYDLVKTTRSLIV